MGNKMQINKITIDNFRAKTHIEMPLGKRLTLLIGENGTGKSTILDAISIGLGAMLTYLPKVTGVSFKNTDIKQTENKTAPYSRVKIETQRGIVWDRTLRRDKTKKTASKVPPAVGLSALKKYLESEIINPFNEGNEFQLPVISYYGVTRALLDVPLRRRGFPKTHQRFESLENALISTTRFRAAFVWFYNKENEEQRKQKEHRSFDYKLPELEAVRMAIEKVFPDITEPHIMLNPLRFAVKMNGETLDIMQLSDGYKTLLSLVIDLASRMALANPQMTNPLEAPAIVLIDEIDLHLHPEWQRRVIGDLLSAFPNTQFVLTTHSPYIVASVNNHLMRYHINNLPFENNDLKNILPLAPNHLAAYYLSGDDITNLMDEEVNLLDDKLIHPFNAISEIYERMRDIQWENKDND
jgi:predicted ATP-binding protein involved in virulence